MKNTLAGLAMLLACFGCSPLSATTPPPTPAEPPAAAKSGVSTDEAAAMTGLYQRLCLQSFPAPAALAAALRPLGASELPVRDVINYLHADPGRAWRLRVNEVGYVLTVEDPPFHTCALRRMTATGLPDQRAYALAVNTYAQAHGLAIRHLPKQVLSLPGGAELTAFSIVLAVPGAKTAHETSLLLLTDYHGHLDRKTWPQSGDGPGVEVRMAHQITRPFQIDTLP